MKRFKAQRVYGYCSRQDAKNDQDGKFVKVKWVRINKGSKLHPNVRCRLVAQEIAYGMKDDELYAGTPSLSTMKMLLSWYASSGSDVDVICIIDVKSAFLYGKARRKVYIELPSQDERSGGPWVGLLDKDMYGTRDAPLIWRATVDAVMKKNGFSCCTLQPGVYVNHERNIQVMIHVDDFLIIGNFHEVKWLEIRLRAEFEIKSTYVGRSHQREVKYLNRTICWTEEGITVESDNKHVQTLLRHGRL